VDATKKRHTPYGEIASFCMQTRVQDSQMKLAVRFCTAGYYDLV